MHIDNTDRKEIFTTEYPLTSYQRDIWIQQCVYPAQPFYNIGGYVVIKGELDLEVFKKAIASVIRSNEALRIKVLKKDGRLYQRITDENTDFLEHGDFSEMANPCEYCIDWMNNEFRKPFALDNGYLYRTALIKISGDTFIWFQVAHHVITDGWGFSLIVRKTADTYNHILKGVGVGEGQKCAYAGFMREHQQYLESKGYEQDFLYWKEKCSRLPQKLFENAYESKRDAKAAFESSRRTMIIERKEYDRITGFSSKIGCSNFHFFLGLLALYLGRVYSKEEVVIGVPVLNRNKADFKNTIGLFVNAIPLKINLCQESHFVDLMCFIKRELSENYRHCKFPIGDTAMSFSGRDPHDRRLYDVSLSYEKHDYQADFQSCTTDTITLTHHSERNALAVFIREFTENEDVRVDFDYNLSLWEDQVPMNNFVSHLKHLIREVLERSDVAVKQLSIIDDPEKHRLLYGFNSAETAFPRNQTVHECFEETVYKAKDAVAVRHEENQLSYGELNEKANQMARVLRERGVCPDSIVGIMADRSCELVVGLLGILKSGGAYLPIDPNYPAERIGEILSDSGTAILLTKREYAKKANAGVEVIIIDDPGNYQGDSSNLEHVSGPRDLAYVIYTSGTTGKPKGVMIEHAGVVNMIYCHRALFEENNRSRFSQMSNISFDAAAFEIWPCLTCGATLFIAGEEIRLDPGRIQKWLMENEITLTLQTTVVAEKLMQLKWPEEGCKLKALRTAGEALRKYPGESCNFEVYNLYGPTEDTVWTTWMKVSKRNESGRWPEIGQPIANHKVFIVGQNNQQQPIGAAGELCVSGVGLARGYLGLPEMTKEKFVPNPFFPGERMYRTGDMARWLPGGDIEFLGRADGQVKIHGFRIELGEVESCLLKHEQIKEAVVIVREDKEKMKYLCAYMTGKEGLTVSTARNYLLKLLPGYMVPSRFMIIEVFPLTANGKINKEELPEPIKSHNDGSEYQAPRDDVEVKLAGMWNDILGEWDIGIHDNFFALGGHSLNALTLATKIHKEFGIELPLMEVFQNPTIEGVAEYIKNARKEDYYSIPRTEQKPYYPVSSAQKRLFILSKRDGIGTSYNMPVAFLLEDELDLNRLEAVFAKLIQRHESLRTSFCMVDNEPAQRIESDPDFHINCAELTENRIDEYIKDFIKPFDLGKAPLLRVAVGKITSQKYILLIDMHHIISDGTSLGILIKEINDLYNGQEPDALRIQYRDFSVWQKEFFDTARVKRQEEYWYDKLSGELPVLDMLPDYPRPQVQSFEGGMIRHVLGGEIEEKLRTLVQESNSTLSIVLMAAFNVLLHKYTSQEDIIIGCGISGRSHSDLENVVGMFVNMLAMRNFPRGEITFKEFLEDVNKTAIEAYENQDCQFDMLVEKLKIKRDLSRNPIFDVSFVLQNMPIPPLYIKDTKAVPYAFEKATSIFSISLHAVEIQNTIELFFEYSSRLFKRSTIERMAEQFETICRVVADSPGIKLSDIRIISREEEEKILNSFNNPGFEPDTLGFLPEAVDELAFRTPMGVALNIDGSELTFGELSRKVHCFARYLEDKQTGRDAVVGVMLDKPEDRIAAVLGIIKAGRTFLPIDSNKSEAVIGNALDEFSVETVIAQKKYVKKLNRLQWTCGTFSRYLCVDSRDARFEQEEPNEMMNKKLWNYLGKTANDDIEGGGWVSSFTGDKFSRDEMDEYGDNVLKKLWPYLNKDTKILEIGCSSGISMYRIAPHVKLYYGTDLSEELIGKNKERVKDKGIQNIKLKTLAAHDIDLLEEKGFDIVVMNSVVQCFHGHNYLRDVVRKAVNALGDSGVLFIGDIMDQDLKDSLVQELHEYKAAHPGLKRTKTDLSSELFISRGYLNDLKEDFQEIEDVRFSNKVYKIENELTKFRYDAIITVDKTDRRQKKDYQRQRWQDGLNELDRYDEEAGCIRVKKHGCKEAEIGQKLEQLINLFKERFFEPQRALLKLNRAEDEESRRILHDFNKTSSAYSEDKTINRLIEAQVAATPGHPAVDFEGRVLNYRELNEWANRLAGKLAALGIGGRQYVGVLCQRSIEMVVAVLGVIKAGAAYVPIEPDFPEARIQKILEDCGACCVITQHTLLGMVQEMQWGLARLKDIICLDVDTPNPPIEEVDRQAVKELWDYVALNATDMVTGGGFTSSYTGESFSEAEVIEYRDRITGLASEHFGPESNLLEIGCGSGLIMFDIAGRVKHYTALDPSQKTQDNNLKRITEEGYSNLELVTGFAHEIDQFPIEDYDLVIISSVVQFFPGLSYLGEVLDKVCRKVKPGGTVIIGDVMDARRKDEFNQSLYEFRKNANSGHGGPVRTKTGTGNELYVHEDFFYNLKDELDAVEDVQVLVRDSGFNNELRFRYDVVIKMKPLHERTGRKKAGEKRRIWTNWHLKELPEDNPQLEAVPENPAYVIYTSGSTGNPKGVVVSHQPVVNLIEWVNKTFSVGAGDRILFVTSLCFDLSVYDIFGILAAGGTIRIASQEDVRNPRRLLNILLNEPITFWDSAPAVLQQVSAFFPAGSEAKTNHTLRLVFLSGDWIPLQLNSKVRKTFGRARVVALGGATEATIWSNYFPVEEVDPKWKSIPYGKPIQNARYYILDTCLNPCPIGVPGDLYIGGGCLARGYLNDPQLTLERFIPDPFSPEKNSRMYKSGDMARWLQDGNIEFLGRKESFIKLKGFRIELEEIKLQLLNHEAVKEAAVAAREDSNGNKILVAFIEAVKDFTVNEMREHLKKTLPYYMIPSKFVSIRSMPYNANGKIDLKALPEIGDSVETGAEYVEPASETEENLVRVWQEVLGAGKIGIEDNFFDLGGDSIKAVQMLSRLHSYQMETDLAAIFKNPTIKELSEHISMLDIKKAGDQEAVEGEVELTPVQSWYFEKFPEGHSHLSQSVLLARKEGFKKEIIEKVFEKMLEHHDALRMIYCADNGGIVQVNRGTREGKGYALRVEAIEDNASLNRFIERVAREEQEKLDLQKGPLVRLALFRSDSMDYFLMIIHHLVIDGVSWRILLEDFAEGYVKGEGGEDIRFAAKTCSFMRWARELKVYAAEKEILRELEYWKSVEKNHIEPIPVDHQLSGNESGGIEGIEIKFDQAQTEMLTASGAKAHNLNIADILVAGLGMTVKDWAGHEKVLISLEGHGRGQVMKEVNTSRTVGWFTSIYPVVLEMDRTDDISYTIKAVKEHLRRIPNKGVGYGILKYGTAKNDGTAIDFKLEPEISFNYMGCIDEGITREAGFEILESGIGEEIGGNWERAFKIGVNGVVSKGQLRLYLWFDKQRYSRNTMTALRDKYRYHLERLMDYCASKTESESTASDFGEYRLSIEEFEDINRKYHKNIERIYALSPMQEGILFHALFSPGTPVYFEQVGMRVKGKLDVEVYEESFNRLIRLNDVLRTAFVYGKVKAPVQVVLKTVRGDFHYEDARGKGESYLEEYREKDIKKGFDLESARLIRIGLFRVSENEYRALWSFHHILMDGWGLAIISRQFLEIYGSLVQGREIEFEKPEAYSRFIQWLESKDKKGAEEYWKKYLSGYEKVALLPGGGHENLEGRYCAEEMTVHIGEDIASKLKKLSKAHEVTLYTVIQTVWGMILEIYNNTQDVVFGNVVSGRPADIEGVEKIAGLFINTIPVRFKSEAGTRFIESARKMQNMALESERYSYIPLAKIQSLTRTDKNLFNHIMVFENYPVQEMVRPGAQNQDTGFIIEDVRLFEQTSYDFNLIITPGECIRIKASYNSLVYKKENVSQIIEHIRKAISYIVENPAARLDEIVILPEEEERRIICEYKGITADYPRNRTIIGLFEEQAGKTPDRTAVVFEDRQLTYEELDRRASSLGRLLSAKGVAPGAIVGIMVERSLEMVVGILGILKSGGAYLPIGPDYPEERIRYMLEDSRASILLTVKELSGKAGPGVQVIDLEDESSYEVHEIQADVGCCIRPDSLAYIIYTSGTTGQPKGVMIEHRNVVQLLFNQGMQFRFDEYDVWTMFHSYCFDFSVWEMYGALLYGGKLVIVPRMVAKDAVRFLKLLKDFKVTVLNQTPSSFKNLVKLQRDDDQKELGIRYVIFGGEALKPSILKDWHRKYPEAKFINMYGITETTVHSTYKEITGQEIEADISNIGKPLPATKVYILDNYRRLAPMGVAGELYIGGAGVARGYMGKPELTCEKFVEDPFNPGGILYRSGDLARFLPNGELEYLGRIDKQVKVRGYRIETGEIESAVLKLEGVMDAVAVAKKDSDGNSYLCAYIVPGKELSVNDLRQSLIKWLPDYMVPSRFVLIDSIPLTANGKLDHRLLPEPGDVVDTGAGYAAPENEIQEKLVQIWQEMLGIKRVGIHDSFFAIGGDSIKAISLLVKINECFKTGIQMRDLYYSQSIKELSAYVLSRRERRDWAEASLEKGLAEIEKIKKEILCYANEARLPDGMKDIYPLSRIQQGMIFYSMVRPDEPVYHDQFTYTVELPGFSIDTFNKAVNILIRKHPMLRTVFYLSRYGRPVQAVLENSERKVTVEDLFRLPHEQQRERVMEYQQDDLRHKFSFEGDPLWRIKVIRTSCDVYEIILSFHHALLDGWSLGMFLKEILQTYGALKDGKNNEFAALKTSYKEYMALSLSRNASDRVRDFWREFLSGYTRNNLPFHTSNKRTGYAKGAGTLGKTMDESFQKKLEAWGRENGFTLKEVCLSAYVYLLSVISAEDDIVTGVVSHNRPVAEDSEKVLGCFLNTLPLRVRVGETVNINGFIRQVGGYLKEIMQNELFLVEIGEAIGQPAGEGNPIFDTMFNFTDFHILEDVDGGDAAGFRGYPAQTGSHEMVNTYFNLHISRTLGKFAVQINYASDLFSNKDIATAMELYEKILSIFAAGGNEITSQDLIPEGHKRKILYVFNNTTEYYPAHQTLQQLFEEQVKKGPDRTAVLFKDSMLTYGELNKKSNQLARLLKSKGVKPNSIVGIIAERSLEMMIGLFGIIKAGGAYLPIDPSDPKERAQYMLENSAAEILLVQAGIATDVEFGGEIIVFGNKEPVEMNDADLDCVNRPSDPVYVIYTSGSTGKPKGVTIEHQSLINRLKWGQKAYPLNGDDTVLQKTPYTFDVSVWELFWWSLEGARCCFLPPKAEKDPYSIVEAVERNHITVMHFVPSMLNIFLEYIKEFSAVDKLRGLKRVFASGEVLTVEQVRLFNEILYKDNSTRLTNLYGPTEATIEVTYFDCSTGENLEKIPIGKPISNIKLFIMGKYGQLQPIGVPGELCISGIGLARGYLNNQPLSDEKFIANPFEPGTRLYKTGDMARWMHDGNVEFLGRLDEQVKIRGFRIELGEIEHHLLRHEDIKGAAVTVRENKDGKKYLCAYFETRRKLPNDELRKYLARYLPEYMIPKYLIAVDRIPLKTNGKLDRSALPIPETLYGEAKADYIEPVGAVEKKVAKAWEEVLGIEKIGCNDNFFEIGGNSLEIIELSTRLTKTLGKEVKVLDLFQYTTIKSFAEFITRGENFHTGMDKFEEEAMKAKTIMKDKLSKLRAIEMKDLSKRDRGEQ